MAVGAGLFATAYIAALFTGVIYWGFPDCDDCEGRAAQLAIPIAGPWLFNRSEAAQWREPSWPWVAWSAAQAAGVGLLIVGLLGHDVSAEKRTPREPRVTLVPVVTGCTTAVSLSFRW